MIMVRKITEVVQYEKLKMQAHFTEMLTATISHDMRTPLNAITGLTENIEPYIVDERGKKFLKIIHYSAQILLFLVNDLLDLFKMKNDKFHKNEGDTNVMEIAQMALDIFTLQA